MTDDRNVMVGAVVTAFGVQAWRSLRKGEIPPLRSFLALAVLTVMLGGIATFSPDIASGLAVLLLVSVLVGAFGRG